MLIKDEQIFNEKHPEAAVFLRSALLREELLSFACKGQHKNINTYEKQRILELIECPACNLRSFLKMRELRGLFSIDCGRNSCRKKTGRVDHSYCSFHRKIIIYLETDQQYESIDTLEDKP